MQARADLVNKAIDVLGISAIGQTADAETFAAVDNVLDPVLASLAAQEIVYIPDTSQIPDELFLDTAVCVANACQSNFGLEAEESVRLRKLTYGDIEVPNDIGAVGRLRAMFRGKPTYERSTAEYF